MGFGVEHSQEQCQPTANESLPCWGHPASIPEAGGRRKEEEYETYLCVHLDET